MLDTYFVRPQTVDRIRASWIGPEIEWPPAPRPPTAAIQRRDQLGVLHEYQLAAA
jgi:hypothetical protein